MSYFNKQDLQCTANWGIWGNRKKMEGNFLKLQEHTKKLEETNRNLKEVIAKLEGGDTNYHIQNETIFTSYIDKINTHTNGNGYGFIGDKYFTNQNVKCNFKKLKKGDLVKYKIIKLKNDQCHVEVLENETQLKEKHKELEKFINNTPTFEDNAPILNNKPIIVESKSAPKKFKVFDPSLNIK